MDGYSLEIKQNFEIIYCCKCGIPFAVPASIREDWTKTGESFYCPNGHSQHYSESEVSKLEKELQRERKRKEWAERQATIATQQAEYAERRRRAQKAVNTKLKKRIGAGVCPCCNRTFKQLAQHMENKHPDYNGE